MAKFDEDDFFEDLEDEAPKVQVKPRKRPAKTIIKVGEELVEARRKQAVRAVRKISRPIEDSQHEAGPKADNARIAVLMERPNVKKKLTHMSEDQIAAFDRIKQEKPHRVAEIDALMDRQCRFKPAYARFTINDWHNYYRTICATPFWVLDDYSVGVLMFIRQLLRLFDVKIEGPKITPQVALDPTPQFADVGRVWGSVEVESNQGPVTVQFESQGVPYDATKDPNSPEYDFNYRPGDKTFEDAVPVDVEKKLATRAQLPKLPPKGTLPSEMPEPTPSVQAHTEPVASKSQVKAQLTEQDTMNNGGTVATPELRNAEMARMEAIRQAGVQGNSLEQKWAIAEEVAHKKPEEIKPIVANDDELYTMVSHCRNWLAKSGEVPKPYPTNLVDIYFPPLVLTHSPEIDARRSMIREKIGTFLRDCKAKKSEGHDPHSKSYRAVLAGNALKQAVEDYANMQPGPDPAKNQTDDGMAFARVGELAMAYFNSQFPLDANIVGPRDLLDPDYITYRGILRKYNLPQGTILHEAKLGGQQ